VAIIDLDLEAPGIGSLFGANSERGVIDVLVDHIATGRVDLDGASMQAQLEGNAGQNITVFPAGRVDDSYIQKLARLDFSSTEPGEDNPVGVALAAILKKIKASYDIILLDARAGLHDLAGMSLHGLAHVDVLVFRGTVQNLEGLGQALRTLGAREDDPELVLIETLLPIKDEEFEPRRQRTRTRAYELLCKYVYPDEDPPQLSDAGVPHDVVSVRRREWLDGIDSFRNLVQNVLNEGELQDVARRVDEACTRSDENDE
jgi:MinD-like ATPase involved in chromosome partitioning or flagellar assembly